MITLLPALIAAAIGAQPVPLASVLASLQPYIIEAQTAFPDCADHIKRVVIVKSIEDEDGGETFGLYSNHKIFLSAEIIAAATDLQRLLVYHEHAHCALSHDAGGVFTEMQAEAAVATKLLYLPRGMTSDGGVITYVAPFPNAFESKGAIQ